MGGTHEYGRVPGMSRGWLLMNDTAWYALGSMAAVLTSFGFVPQISKMWRTRSVKDVSPVTLGQFEIGRAHV